MQAIEPRHFELLGVSNPALKFRPERLTPESLKVGSAVIKCAAVNDGSPCRLVNVSASGAAFELPGHDVLRNGQVLDGFCVTLDDVRLYEGRATIVNQRRGIDRDICGVSFLDAYLPATALDNTCKAAAALRETARRLLDAEAVASASIDDWVKAFVADFRLFLETLRRTFEAVVPPGAPVEVTDGVIRYVEKETRATFHALVHRCNDVITRVKKSHLPAVQQYIKAQLHDLLLPSPLFRQSYYKPLGYAGDFVVMSMLYGDHYQGDTTYARFLNRLLSKEPVSLAVISRLRYLGTWIARLANEETSGEFRVLSVASGPARELRDFLACYAGPQPLMISLLDQDPRALAFAQASFAPLMPRLLDHVSVRYINAGVKQLIREAECFPELRDLHLIYSAGLFDYLPTAAAKALLTKLFSMLAEGGVLIIGNLSEACEDRGFLECAVDWSMIYRTRDDLTKLAATVPARRTSLEAEETGINRFLVLQR